MAKTKITLPPQCFSVLMSCNQIIVIKNGEHGYHEFTRQPERMDEAEAEGLCDKLNKQLGVTRGQRMAMEAGSMTGNWNGGGADPNNWSEDGKWIKQENGCPHDTDHDGNCPVHHRGCPTH